MTKFHTKWTQDGFTCVTAGYDGFVEWYVMDSLSVLAWGVSETEKAAEQEIDQAVAVGAERKEATVW